jgi:hypothetical protein
MAKMAKTTSGFRSGLEERVAKQLLSLSVPFQYEKSKVSYVVPEKPHWYTPDFVMGNGVIIETKGEFSSSDRVKHLLIQKQHPCLDIRFVFSNSRAKLSKKSNTTYACWCTKHGFMYADKLIPIEWTK